MRLPSTSSRVPSSQAAHAISHSVRRFFPLKTDPVFGSISRSVLTRTEGMGTKRGSLFLVWCLPGVPARRSNQPAPIRFAEPRQAERRSRKGTESGVAGLWGGGPAQAHPGKGLTPQYRPRILLGIA